MTETETKTEIVRVLKIVEYSGSREWVEHTLKQSLKRETCFGKHQIIRTALIGSYPEVLKKKGEENA